MLTDKATGDTAREIWQDVARPAADRAADLLARMTLEEKVAQLGSAWVASSPNPGAEVAPHQYEFAESTIDWAKLVQHGLGQLTRPYGTAPVEPVEGAQWLRRRQAEIVEASRFGIPALVHEECLVGFMTWRATVFPTPLAWGATFDPALIELMATHIGATMRSAGVHQGLAPVLDVVRDPRWGRTEETVGEDPYLVATVGSAYVRGLQQAGIIATLKHFAAYSASRAGRNFGPVAVGPRELADVLLPPFELALREGAGSVMHSYAEIDGVPAAADVRLLTGLLRDELGFTGTVVADYFGVSFLQTLHGVAADPAAAAALALAAGVDVELPATRCYGEPLLDAVRSGAISETLIDRAADRVLRQKIDLGLLDRLDPPTAVDFDPAASRDLARRVAEESVVLLANDGTLPLRAAKIALVGPYADDVAAMLGCYSFAAHHGLQADPGVDVPTLRTALPAELPAATFTDDIADADVCVAVVGDTSGLFGRGTTGEGCDVEDLSLPGDQDRFLSELLDIGTPVVLVLLTGRPYALGAYADRCAAIVQAFLPGEEGASAVAGVLSGRVNPSGRLPIGIPRGPGGQPAAYLGPRLAHRTGVSSVDPTPLYAFGHGLAYTSFSWSDVTPAEPTELAADETITVSLTVTNDGDRPGAEIVQLYLHDPVAQVTRPVQRLVGYARVPLDAGRSTRVSFRFHPDLAAFTGLDGRRIVEPGDLELRLAASSTDLRATIPLHLTGPERVVGHDRVMVADVTLGVR
ncbi:beta-xylosidase [Hamadaea flava]|uniref:Glycoside hydrolase family 3 N-terminal domain-containing protein n=1 Tax=Hamadaea flava TaxID=1742688 RepID=A0ABV8LUG7_9ACTN|nr:glycoside hydrolase family 3 N-terminal domain-containing protein [Hamadaea flava]MCP2327523.1 beta-xylosidase [Hamadaea flava]